MATLEQQRQNEITEIGNLALAHFETLSDDDKSWYVRHLAMSAAMDMSAASRKRWLAELRKKTNTNGDQAK